MALFNDVDTFDELRDAISFANGNAEADTINITGDITLTADLPLIAEANRLTINGGNRTISGNDERRIFFVRSGNIVLDDLTLTQGKAQGTNGSGGGAGMGGALFIYDGSVAVSDTTFSSNKAIGGNGSDGFGDGGGIGLSIPNSNGTSGSDGINGGDGGDGGFGGNGGNGGRGNGGNGGNGGDGGDGGNGGNGGDGDSFGGNGGNGGFGGGGGNGGGSNRVLGNGDTVIGGGGFGGFGGGGGSGGSGGFGGFGGSNGSERSGGSGAGMGGAVFIRSGSFSLTNVHFSSNAATGGIGSLALFKVDSSSNGAIDGTGEQAGKGLGGAIFAMKSTTNPNGNNQGMPTMLPTVILHTDVTFTDNVAADAADQTQNRTGADLNSAAVYGLVQQNTAPTISGTPTLTIDEDTAYRFTPDATDPDTGDTRTFAIENKPRWATFDPTTGTLSGTPTNDAVGITSNISISVSDASGVTTVLPTFDLTVSNVNDAPTVAIPIVNQTARAGNPFRLVLPTSTFADVDAGDTLTLVPTLVNGGALPAWLKFDAATRTFSGSPTRNNAGTIEIKVTATDRAQASISNLFTLTVQTPIQPTGTPTAPIAFDRKASTVEVIGTNQGELLKGSWLNDVLIGKGGNDVLTSGYGKAKAGQDTLSGGAGDDRLVGGAGNDLLEGGSGNDRLVGGKGRDLLRGGSGDDLLSGSAGDDILVGGTGNDTLVGSGGKDMFVFNTLSGGSDVIRGFNTSQDVVDLRSIFKRPEFSGTSSFDKYQQYVQLVQVGANTEVRIDADGSSAGQDFVMLASFQNLVPTSLSSTNFVI